MSRRWFGFAIERGDKCTMDCRAELDRGNHCLCGAGWRMVSLTVTLCEESDVVVLRRFGVETEPIPLEGSAAASHGLLKLVQDDGRAPFWIRILTPADFLVAMDYIRNPEVVAVRKMLEFLVDVAWFRVVVVNWYMEGEHG